MGRRHAAPSLAAVVAREESLGRPGPDPVRFARIDRESLRPDREAVGAQAQPAPGRTAIDRAVDTGARAGEDDLGPARIDLEREDVGVEQHACAESLPGPPE